ncbi:MAG: hypothetical protein ACRD2N_03860 [Vicinamibacterales bacterium]
MKLPWKKLSFIGIVIAALAACSQRPPLSPSALSSDSSAGSLSAVTGNGAPKGKLVFSWNLIGTPGDYEGGCGNGRRIFVERGANHEHILFHDHNDGWHIEQCDATFGDTAVIHSDSLGTLDVYARILGKPNGRLRVCADTVTDHATNEGLCLLGTIDLKRDGGRSRFQVQPDSLFDASLEDIIWNVETNTDFRIAQFRVYQQ